MPRQNVHGVVENAEFNINKEVYEKNHVDIFGEPPKQFCDDCGNRLAYCNCKKETMDFKETAKAVDEHVAVKCETGVCPVVAAISDETKPHTSEEIHTHEDHVSEKTLEEALDWATRQVIDHARNSVEFMCGEDTEIATFEWDKEDYAHAIRRKFDMAPYHNGSAVRTLGVDDESEDSGYGYGWGYETSDEVQSTEEVEK